MLTCCICLSNPIPSCVSLPNIYAMSTIPAGACMLFDRPAFFIYIPVPAAATVPPVWIFLQDSPVNHTSALLSESCPVVGTIQREAVWPSLPEGFPIQLVYATCAVLESRLRPTPPVVLSPGRWTPTQRAYGSSTAMTGACHTSRLRPTPPVALFPGRWPPPPTGQWDVDGYDRWMPLSAECIGV